MGNKIKSIKVGGPFEADAFQGPLTSKLQYDRVSAHIQAGKDEGATVHLGGGRHGTAGYFIDSAIFSRDISRAISVAKEIKAGTVWVNCYNTLENGVPFGGFKMSGIGRELSSEAILNYTAVKAVHINLNGPNPL